MVAEPVFFICEKESQFPTGIHQIKALLFKDFEEFEHLDENIYTGTAKDAFISNSVNILLPEISPNDLALLQFSSGSTQMPKGVMLTHSQIIANLEHIRSILHKTEAAIHQYDWMICTV